MQFLQEMAIKVCVCMCALDTIVITLSPLSSHRNIVSDIAVFVLKRDVKLQLTN